MSQQRKRCGHIYHPPAALPDDLVARIPVLVLRAAALYGGARTLEEAELVGDVFRRELLEALVAAAPLARERLDALNGAS